MRFDEIISHFPGGKMRTQNTYRCHCPAHNDKEPSLDITYNQSEGKTIMYCLSGGCSTEDILKSVGLKMSDLFDKSLEKNDEPEKVELTNTYVYTDEKENPKHRSLRYKILNPKNPERTKTFTQQQYIDGKWINGTNQLKPEDFYLYRYSKVYNAKEVYFVEGEKDAETAEQKLEVVATTSCGGAQGFDKHYENYIKQLKDKIVYIVPDNDKPGRMYANNVMEKLEGSAKSVKILNISRLVPDLKRKGDITDLFERKGKEQTLKILTELRENTEAWQKVGETEIINMLVNLDDSIDKSKMRKAEKQAKITEVIFKNDFYEKLFLEETSEKTVDRKDYDEDIAHIETFCLKYGITGFNKRYNKFKKEKQESAVEVVNTGLVIEDFSEKKYEIKNYFMGKNDGALYRMTNNGGLLVTYNPIIPLEFYNDIRGSQTKVKIAFKNIFKCWDEMAVDYSSLQSSVALANLAKSGVQVTTENAREIVKFLNEFISLNEIPIKQYSSTLGWTEDGKLIPYTEDIIFFDKGKDIKKLYSTAGTLEEWVDYYKERRKFSSIARIAMATGIASILTTRLKEAGFIIHIYGDTGTGKSVASVVAQSIFGKADDKENGLACSWKVASPASFEANLAELNNLPLFLEEAGELSEKRMSYNDAIMLLSNGKGAERTNINIETTKSKTWCLAALSTGEIDVISSTITAGAINRCISCEMLTPSYDGDLKEVAEFAKEHYGQPIREILKHLNEFDIRELHKKYRKELQNNDTTAKQVNILSLLKIADKIITDVIFKDEYYLTNKELLSFATNKNEIAIEKRAYDAVMGWTTTNWDKFLKAGVDDKFDDLDRKGSVFGKIYRNPKTNEEGIAILTQELKKALEGELGFPSSKEVFDAWYRKGYLMTDAGRKDKNVRFGNEKLSRCIVLKTNINNYVSADKPADMPF